MAGGTRPYVELQPGEHAPWFHQRSGDHPNYALDAAAGRYLVLCFFASSKDPLAKRALKSVAAERALFDDARFSFFGVTMDRGDDNEKRVKTKLPGIRYLFDFDGTVGRLYGALPADLKAGEGNVSMRRFWAVIGPNLRVLRIFAFEADGSEQAALFGYLKSLPPAALVTGFARAAPVIMLDNIFETELCDGLIALYDKHTRHGDYAIENKALIQAIQIRVQRRLLPEVLKAYQFRATRMERNVISSSAEASVLPPHRDNTSRATAHRRFSVSINLNGDFEGGETDFPEYGPPAFKPPKGGACVYSSSLLHGDGVVTAGKRYALTSFLYDEEATKVRVENEKTAGALSLDIPRKSARAKA
ncbi:MAG TPA: redoxin domain-containing protein [Rhizomicrobium sp.]